MYTVGAHVHIEDDAGVTLGVGRRMYLFASSDIEAPRSGWYVFLLPGGSLKEAVLRSVESLGIEVRTAAPEPGITAGLSRVIATRFRGRAGFRDIRFSASAPTEACISTQLERAC